jgi:hypothetical protein
VQNGSAALFRLPAGAQTSRWLTVMNGLPHDLINQLVRLYTTRP